MSLAVVGADHPNRRGPGRRFEIQMCKPSEPVELRLEPKNPADPHAVAVFSVRNVQIGYVTAERAPWIGAMIRNGREIRTVFQCSAKFGAVIRCAIDGKDPELPPQESAAKDAIDEFDQRPPDEWGE